MADERDPEVSRRYRELASEEPPRALDERILARARRRQGFRWYGPVAAAAVLALVVAVTVQMERRQPEGESTPAALPANKIEPFTAPAQPSPPPMAPEPRPQLRDSASESATHPAEARERKQLQEQAPPPEEARAMRREAPSLGAAAALDEAPEAALERIAELRRQGRHEEADEGLKRFRERFPDYSVSDEVRAKVEKK